MLWRVEVRDKFLVEGLVSSAGQAGREGVNPAGALSSGIKKDIEDLGIGGVESIEVAQVYIIKGALRRSHIDTISADLLSDPVIQEYAISATPLGNVAIREKGRFVVEVAYNPGVMDPVEDSVKKAILDLGIEGVTSVKTAKRWTIKADISAKDLNMISEKLLYNKVIQHVVTSPDSYISENPHKYHFKLINVDLLKTTDRQLEKISEEGQLFLNLSEMRRIKEYFSRLDRNPADIEIETLAQTWSEHCGHKTFRGMIEYKEEIQSQLKTKNSKPKTRLIDNLLKSTIMKATEELKKPWCVSVFSDNSGIITFDERYNVCFKVETHNHPSAIEPYGGANTGLGGVIRDPIGTGLGAKPILSTDVFCFAEPDYPFKKLPKGVLHPKRIMKGVVAGVRDYGNKMGIPTVNGTVVFDNRYLGNPLVYCGNVGIMPKDKSFKEVKKGDSVILVGGRTGRDGIHGATFSSGELTSESEKISAQAVQIGNPIEEKKMLDCVLKARDMGLYNAITDCGGGGLSSAVGEMGEKTGVKVDLEKVPLKYNGLSYTEIWISEAQERMILAAPKKNVKRLLNVFKEEDVEATVIGEFSGKGKLELRYEGNKVCDLDMDFLHSGLPKTVRQARWRPQICKEPKFPCPEDLTPLLFKVLSSWNVCSKEWVVRQYDHEVQAGSVIKPFVGVANDGPSDAAVYRPLLDSGKGIVLSNGINPGYGQIDPYWMAASCIDEALRQIIAVGGDLNKTALLDNFCWGDTDQPEQLGSLVRAAYGCYDTAKGYKTPFISGKDSLHNEYIVGKRRVSIPGTLLISAISIIEDIAKAITMDFKDGGDYIYIVGQTRDELGGSRYFALQGFSGNNVPKVDMASGGSLMDKLSRAIKNGFVRACHDCSDGGIGVSAAEMAFAGGKGAEIHLNKVPYKGAQGARNDFILFSESNARFIVEVREQDKYNFEKIMKGAIIGLAGKTNQTGDFMVYGLDGNPVVQADISELKETWQRPLRW
ncbi:MAG: phosphoribosylformylglycinamidine synthase subunit PurL [Candidatus Omnitrophota bacterium]